MKILTCEIKEDHAYIIPIADLHVGDKGFNTEAQNKLDGYIDWVKQTPNARVFLNGDLLNTATRTSKTNPHDQDMDLADSKDWVVNRFTPIKDQIIGAVSGNHEERIEDFAGDNPLRDICYRLQIPYCGYTALVDFKIGKRNKGKGRENATAVQYTGLFHHTTGGGGTIGSKLNRVEALRKICRNADFYCGSHNHMLGAVPVVAVEYNPYSSNTTNRVQLLVDCGSYLSWEKSYAEAKALEPVKLGSPRIRLDGKKKDIHVSL